MATNNTGEPIVVGPDNNGKYFLVPIGGTYTLPTAPAVVTQGIALPPVGSPPPAGYFPYLLADGTVSWKDPTTVFVGAPATSPTDGQLLSWSASLGAWTPVNPTGSAEVAYAANVTGTGTAVATTGGQGATVDIPGCAISVPASNGRPVMIHYGAVITASVAAIGSFYLQLVETTGTATALHSHVIPAPQQTGTLDASDYVETIVAEFRIGAVASTRTFKLSALTYSAAGVALTMTALNATANPSYIRAVAG